MFFCRSVALIYDENFIEIVATKTIFIAINNVFTCYSTKI